MSPISQSAARNVNPAKKTPAMTASRTTIGDASRHHLSCSGPFASASIGSLEPQRGPVLCQDQIIVEPCMWESSGLVSAQLRASLRCPSFVLLARVAVEVQVFLASACRSSLPAGRSISAIGGLGAAATQTTQIGSRLQEVDSYRLFGCGPCHPCRLRGMWLAPVAARLKALAAWVPGSAAVSAQSKPSPPVPSSQTVPARAHTPKRQVKKS